MKFADIGISTNQLKFTDIGMSMDQLIFTDIGMSQSHQRELRKKDSLQNPQWKVL